MWATMSSLRACTARAQAMARPAKAGLTGLKLSQVSGRTMGAVKPNGGARAFRQSTNKVKLVACQANRMCFSSAAAGSDEEQIKSIIADFAAVDGKDGKAPGVEHMTEDFLFVRPSGNPMTPAVYSEMRASPDVTVTSSQLLSVKKLEVDGNMAYAVYITHAVFDFKGTPNDDVAVYTSIFQKDAQGTWKMVHGQRSTGRGPEDDPPGPF